MSLLSKYPTERTEETQTPEKTMKEKEYTIMLENGREIKVEANYTNKVCGKLQFYQLEADDLQYGFRSENAVIREGLIPREPKMEIKTGDIAVKQQEVQATWTAKGRITYEWWEEKTHTYPHHTYKHEKISEKSIERVQ